jgi:hypothetical protein
MSLPATPQEGFLVNVGELVCLTSVGCSGGSLYKIECARDNDACRVAKADDCVEAFAFGNCRGQEQGADQFQDQCGENPYKKSCDNFAHTLNVVFLWPIENVFAVKFAKLNA